MGSPDLFLLGGNIAVFELMADEFLAAAGGAEANLAILLIGGEGWEKRKPEYADHWLRRGVTRLQFIVPNEEGVLDTEAASALIRQATGIIVGGGNTREYQRLYATEPLRSVIRAQVEGGAAYAGLSAGALLAPEACMLRPYAEGATEPAFVPGLGLLTGLAIGVHFSLEDRLDLMRQAMLHTGTSSGLAIEEDACVMLRDGQPVRVFGQSAYRAMCDDASTGSCALALLV